MDLKNGYVHIYNVCVYMHIYVYVCMYMYGILFSDGKEWNLAIYDTMDGL